MGIFERNVVRKKGHYYQEMSGANLPVLKMGELMRITREGRVKRNISLVFLSIAMRMKCIYIYPYHYPGHTHG